MNNDEIIKDIPLYCDWTEITVPPDGSSPNQKFRVIDKEGKAFIVRVSDIAFYDKKKKEFENIKRLSGQDIQMPLPVDFGLCNSGKSVYMVLTWIEGTSVENCIFNLDKDMQYRLGILSGRLLQKIHACSKIEPTVSWKSVFEADLKETLRKYYASGITIQYEKEALNYLDKNINLLENRPQVIRHGDFHVGNLIITPVNKIATIDFDECKIGDPWWEFSGTVWACRLSPLFAKGQVDGYFDNNPPGGFFQSAFPLYC